MAQIVVRVTERDIVEGKRGAPRYCPVALAIKRKTKLRPSVARLGVTFRRGVGDVHVKLPLVASKFIANFDTDQAVPMKPFEFELEIPDSLVKEA